MPPASGARGASRPAPVPRFLTLLLACACLTGDASAQGRGGEPPPDPAPVSPATASWLVFHGSQRTRFETIDHRYTPLSVGGDQHVAFRTRLQAEVITRPAWLLAELQDTRLAGTDSGSHIDNTLELGAKVLQLHAGARRRNLWGSGLDVQLEAGRFSRDFGMRRLIARNVYRNTTNAFDGAIARVGGPAWAVQVFRLRPLTYAYPGFGFDDRYRDERLSGIYATATRHRSMKADAYLLKLDDGARAPATLRRRLTTPGLRLYGLLGPSGRLDYEIEASAQWGDVGGRRHRAAMAHGQVDYGWTRHWRPRVAGLYDHATGDRDPADARNGTFDNLYGARRFELGPSGVYGLVARSNLRSPGAQLTVQPTPAVDVRVQYRGLWLDQARDSWQSADLRDESGAAGRSVGRQTELRLRYRWAPHVEFDGAVLFFEEGRFPRTLKPAPAGHVRFLTLSTEVRF